MAEHGRVILPEAFRQRLSPEHIKELEARGVEVNHLDRLQPYALAAPQPGELAVGVLTSDEVEMFVRWKDAAASSRALQKQLEARQYRANAEAIEASKEEAERVEQPNIVTVEDIRQIARLSDTAAAYRDMLAVMVRERLDLWHFAVLFRSDGRVCTGQRRTAQGCDE